MAAISVGKMSLKEIVALQARLEKAIGETRRRERSEEKIAALAVESGFSVSELFGTGRSGKGSKVAPKTWTGRGRLVVSALKFRHVRIASRC